MTKIDLFYKLMEKAKSNGYDGPDYAYEVGMIINGTNAYALFFRKDFAKAIWGENETMVSSGKGLHSSSKKVSRWELALSKMAIEDDKWKFLKNNVNFD